MTRILLLVAALCCNVVTAGCDEHPAPAPTPPRPVVTVRVEPSSRSSTGNFPGTVQARYMTMMGFRIGGRVLARHAEVGDSIRQGANLAELDPTDEKNSLISAEADVANAVGQMTNASGTFDRTNELVARGDSPRARLDTATANRDAAAARLEAAQAQLAKARETLSYTQLLAPFDGVVLGWATEAGQQVQAGQTVVTIARPDVLEVAVDVPTEQLREILQDSTLTVASQTVPPVTTTATVRERGAMADASTRTQRLLLAMPSRPASLRIGSTVTVTMSHAVRPQVTLPDSVLLKQNGKTYVWLVQNGHVDRKEVTVLDQSGGKVVLDNDIPPGTEVVTAGVHSLSEGQPVRLASR